MDRDRKNWSHKYGRMVARNQVWLRPDDNEPVRVLAVGEGWAMVRRKGCMPDCVSVKDLNRHYKLDRAPAQPPGIAPAENMAL